MSVTIRLNTGVPQGSMRSPLLFTLYGHTQLTPHEQNCWWCNNGWAPQCTEMRLSAGCLAQWEQSFSECGQNKWNICWLQENTIWQFDHIPLSINTSMIETLKNTRFLRLHHKLWADSTLYLHTFMMHTRVHTLNTALFSTWLPMPRLHNF